MFFRETGWEMASWHEIFEEAPLYQWSFFQNHKVTIGTIKITRRLVGNGQVATS